MSQHQEDELAKATSELHDAESELANFYKHWGYEPHSYKGPRVSSVCLAEVYKLQSFIDSITRHDRDYIYQQGSACWAGDKTRIETEMMELAKAKYQFLENIEKQITEYLETTIRRTRELFAITIEPTKSLLEQKESLEDRVKEAKRHVFECRIELVGGYSLAAKFEKEGFNLCFYERKPDVPKEAGVYLLYDNSDLLYVGQSQDVRHRLSSNDLYREGLFIGVLLTPDVNTRLALEKRLIQELHPSSNIMWSSETSSSSQST